MGGEKRVAEEKYYFVDFILESELGRKAYIERRGGKQRYRDGQILIVVFFFYNDHNKC